jgi:hypothetical protein
VRVRYGYSPNADRTWSAIGPTTIAPEATTVATPAATAAPTRAAVASTGRYTPTRAIAPAAAATPKTRVSAPVAVPSRSAKPAKSSPLNGRRIAPAVSRPAPREVRMRTGSAGPSLGASDRRMTTKPTRMPRMPSWSLVRTATTASAEAVSRRSLSSSRKPRSRKMEPAASAWPQIALLNQVIGFTRITTAAMPALRVEAPSSTAIRNTSAARPRSANIGRILIPSPMLPPIRKLMTASRPR